LAATAPEGWGVRKTTTTKWKKENVQEGKSTWGNNSNTADQAEEKKEAKLSKVGEEKCKHHRSLAPSPKFTLFPLLQRVEPFDGVVVLVSLHSSVAFPKPASIPIPTLSRRWTNKTTASS
jgi:hypothetical protein